MTSKKTKTKTTNLHISLFRLAIASVLWQVSYIVFAVSIELREKIIFWGLLGPNCHSCEAQTAQSIILVTAPLLVGAVGLGFAAYKGLSKEKKVVRSTAGILIGFAVFGLSYYFFLFVNFAVNFAR